MRCGAARWDTIGRGGARGRAVRKTDDAHSRSGACTKRRARPIDSNVQYSMTKRAGPERRKLLIAGSGSLVACTSYLLPHPSHLWLSYLLFCAVPSRAVVLACSVPILFAFASFQASPLICCAFSYFFSIFDLLFYASHLPLGSGPSLPFTSLLPKPRASYRPPTPSPGICTIHTILPLETRSSYSP